MSLAEKWEKQREAMEHRWNGNVPTHVEEIAEAAFYAGAEAVAEDYSIQNVKVEVAAFKKGSVR